MSNPDRNSICASTISSHSGLAAIPHQRSRVVATLTAVAALRPSCVWLALTISLIVRIPWNNCLDAGRCPRLPRGPQHAIAVDVPLPSMTAQQRFGIGSRVKPNPSIEGADGLALGERVLNPY